MTIPFRTEVINLSRNDRIVRKDFIFTLFDFKSVRIDNNKRKRPFRLLKFTMNLLGILPLTISETTKAYEFRWSKSAPIHCLLSILWLSTLVVLSGIGLFLYFPCIFSCLTRTSTLEELLKNVSSFNSTYDSSGLEVFHAEEFMGVLVSLQSIYNAWVQVITVFYRRYEIADFLNNWSKKVFAHDIDPMYDLFFFNILGCLVLYAFSVSFVMCCVIGKPVSLINIMNALSTVLFLNPYYWGRRWITSGRVRKLKINALILFYLFIIFISEFELYNF